MADISHQKPELKTTSILNELFQTVRVSRPLHWVKNFSVFAALIFSGGLFDTHLFTTTLLAFFAFNFATSATYIFNDLIDAELDRLHPFKKRRPIASYELSKTTAVVALIAHAIAALFVASYINLLFFIMIIGYLFLQVVYSLGLKNIPIVDILIIASGFVIRVYAGAFAIDAHLSVWFLLCVISAALFLASGKRRAELGIITTTQITTRKSLTRYSESLLDSYVTMFANAAWLSWALFTFFESPQTAVPIWLFLAEISRTTTVSKLMMITIPIVIFGIMRYQALIFANRAESPERLLLKDKSLVASALLWISLVVWILYGGVARMS